MSARPPLLRQVKTGLYMITAICGLIDAACFLALGGVFVEMMTGNLLLMAISFGRGQPLAGAEHYMPALVWFTVGVMLGGRLLRGPQKIAERRIGFAVEWLLLIGATVWAAASHPDGDNFEGRVLVAVLALAMGLQNAMVRHHGVPDLATNVMTLTLAGIIADSTLAGGDNRNWRRRVASVALFVASATLGALLLQWGIVWPLLAASVILTVAMVPLLYGEAWREG